MQQNKKNPKTQRKQNRVLEKEIENSILDYLKANVAGVWFKHQSVGLFDPTKRIFRKVGKHHLNGVSDILGVLHPSGKFVAIEVKRPKQKLSPQQKEFIDLVNLAGGIGLRAESTIEVRDALFLEKQNRFISG